MLVLDGQFIIASDDDSVIVNDKESIMKDPSCEKFVDLQQDKKYDHMILQARNITHRC